MQLDDSSSSDDHGWPDLMQSDPGELTRIRARNFMQHMLLTTAFFAAFALFEAAASAESPSLGRSASVKGRIGRNGCLADSDPPNTGFIGAFTPHSRGA